MLGAQQPLIYEHGVKKFNSKIIIYLFLNLLQVMFSYIIPPTWDNVLF